MSPKNIIETRDVEEPSETYRMELNLRCLTGSKYTSDLIMPKRNYKNFLEGFIIFFEAVQSGVKKLIQVLFPVIILYEGLGKKV